MLQTCSTRARRTNSPEATEDTGGNNVQDSMFVPQNGRGQGTGCHSRSHCTPHPGLVDAAALQNSAKAKSEKVILRAKTLSLSDFMGPFLH